MSTIGGTPIDTSLLQTAQAQQTASKSRDRERAVTERARRYQDLVELRVAGVESDDAVRALPQNDSEQAEDEHQRQVRQGVHRRPSEGEDDRPSIDLTA